MSARAWRRRVGKIRWAEVGERELWDGFMVRLYRIVPPVESARVRRMARLAKRRTR